MVWFRVTQTGTWWNCDVWQISMYHGLLGLTRFGYARGEVAGGDVAVAVFIYSTVTGGGLDEQELK